MRDIISSITAYAVIISLACCGTIDNNNPFDFNVPGGPGAMGPSIGGGNVSNDGSDLGIDGNIKNWDGTRATDADKDVVGTDADLYHEANTFGKKVTVTFDGNTAQVSSTHNSILSHVDGAYVVIDMATNSVSGVEIELTGTSTDGGIKIYGEKKFKLTLNALSLASSRGPAINNQCKKRMFLVVADGTDNSIADASSYSDDNYYLDPSASEDRKGCLFSEGNIILSGSGLLEVRGRYKHAVVTDNSFVMRPGATLVIQEAAKNGLHVKGKDNVGVKILGGYIYAHIGAQAGKAIKTDLDTEICGGVLELNTSGDAIYDQSENDTSSAACIKTDGSIIITGGALTLKSTGSGGKGLNADADINISGGEIAVATSGSKYTYTKDLDSSPKGVKADGDINISGGEIKIMAIGKNEGAEGLESKSTLSISGGNVQVYAYDDAINAAKAINISGGYVYAYAINNDGIDSNGTLTISGGTVLASGSSAPEGGLDCDDSRYFRVDGGVVMAVGGTMQSLPSSSSSQYSVVCNRFSAQKGATVKLTDASSNVVATFDMPRTVRDGNLFLSSESLKANASYTISVADSKLCSFTTTSKIVTALK